MIYIPNRRGVACITASYRETPTRESQPIDPHRRSACGRLRCDRATRKADGRQNDMDPHQRNGRRRSMQK